MIRRYGWSLDVHAIPILRQLNGTIRGQGRIDWSAGGKVTSTGDFSTANLDLAAPFGPVTGLSGNMHFNDLLVVPEHVYSQGDFKTDFISRAVGTGPYRLVRRVPGQEVLLERRPEYWGPRPPLRCYARRRNGNRISCF